MSLPVTRVVRMRPGHTPGCPCGRESCGGYARPRARTALFPPTASAAERARRFVSSTLAAWAAADRFDQYVLELVVTELFSNALRPSRGGSWVRITVTLIAGTVRVEVHDPDPRVPGPPRRPGDDSESGRGLLLVQALSSSWGAVAKRTGGKYVYADLAPAPVAA